MKFKVGSLLKVFSEDIGIDLGTANTIVVVKNKGIVLNEPSVIAVNTKSGKIVEVGNKAKLMIGKTPDSIQAIRPLKNGVIADYEMTERMLRAFYKIVLKRNMFTNPKVVICVPAGVTQVEKRAVVDATKEAGAREAYLIEEPMAAAIGAGIDIFQPEGNMVIDIGGGTTEIAVISLGGIVISSSLRVAGDKLDEAIVQYVRQKHNLLIGEKTAEEVKNKIAIATDESEELSAEIRGRNILNGLPRNITIKSSEIKEAIAEYIEAVIEEVKVTLEKTPPELAADIYQKGIVLVGGGALIRDLDKKISKSILIPVIVSEEPLNCVIRGIEAVLKDFDKYREVIVAPSDY